MFHITISICTALYKGIVMFANVNFTLQYSLYQLPSLRQIIIFKAHGNTGKHNSTKLYANRILKSSVSQDMKTGSPLLVSSLYHFTSAH